MLTVSLSTSHNISHEAISSLEKTREKITTGEIPHLSVYQGIDINRILGLAELFKDAEEVWVLGTGGSRFGGEALCALAQPIGTPQRVRFFSNVDPWVFQELLKNTTNWGKIKLLVISKSGNTTETLSQLGQLLPYLPDAHEQVFCLTENPESVLGIFAKEKNLQLIPHDPIGGRFSALTTTGLLPAAIAGVNVGLLHQSFLKTFETLLTDGEQLHFLESLSQLWELYTEHKIANEVLFAYGDNLLGLGTWFKQLLAESTGKDGKGMTPILAQGTEDQHSQLQLYQDGPDNKRYTFISVKNHPILPAILEPWPGDNPFYDTTLSQVFRSYETGTRLSLIEAGRPCRQLLLENFDEVSLGAAMAFLTLEVMVLGPLLEVNIYDQPGVEQSKALAKEHLRDPVEAIIS